MTLASATDTVRVVLTSENEKSVLDFMLNNISTIEEDIYVWKVLYWLI